jgi:four helix bundle protein
MPNATGIAHVEELEIWRDGVDLVETVYRITLAWPKHEAFGLTSQVRRSVISVPANLAEGLGRGGHAEIARFASIALGSLYELDTHLIIALRLGYSSEDDLVPVRSVVLSLIRRTLRFLRFHQRAEPEQRPRQRRLPTTNHQPPTTR